MPNKPPDPNTASWFYSAVEWAQNHPYYSWGTLSAFFVSLWTSLSDGRGWIHSIFGAVLAVLITLSLLAVMKLAGWHEEWMPLIGMLVGFVGADRIRSAILGAWESHKGRLSGNNNDKQQ